MTERSREAVRPRELQNFLDTFLDSEESVLVDEILRLDTDGRKIEALLDTTRVLPFAASQRVSELHPAHVSAGDLLMATGSLGCLHAYFFHGCRWDEGWAGFGNRVHRADFKRLSLVGPPVELLSSETRTRVGASRVVIRFNFEFRQEGQLVYVGDQSAMFVKGKVVG